MEDVEGLRSRKRKPSKYIGERRGEKGWPKDLFHLYALAHGDPLLHPRLGVAVHRPVGAGSLLVAAVTPVVGRRKRRGEGVKKAAPTNSLNKRTHEKK